ncbi:dual specificity protein phosphatase 19-like [Coccinella septempunctata]|uniref:dual specificity protein phosphatase 19-like n=1 Tax=Coccinella septempunctata TaxID=41139 RepID=UPI001D06AA32|nr:dual specificity protein phosphatase 19-like [Coccinella septempunctata]
MSFLADLVERKNNLKPTETVITFANGQCLKESRAMTLPVQIEKKPFGFIVDNKPDDKPAKILEYLYLGSQDCCSKEVLQAYDISNILSIGIEAPLQDDNIKNQFLECLDLPETNIWNTIKTSVEVIRKSVNNCESILVHCNAGISRSASVVIGYLMLEYNYSFDNAYEHVRSARPVIRPNDGFMKQLKNYHLYI